MEVARQDVPTCLANERLGAVRDRVQATGHHECVVVNEEGVVFGRLRRTAWGSDPDALVEDVMELGPTTIRPDVFVHEFVERMRRRKVGSVLVTTSGGEEGGRLLGVLHRQDTEEVLAEQGSPDG